MPVRCDISIFEFGTNFISGSSYPREIVCQLLRVYRGVIEDRLVVREISASLKAKTTAGATIADVSRSDNDAPQHLKGTSPRRSRVTVGGQNRAWTCGIERRPKLWHGATRPAPLAGGGRRCSRGVAFVNNYDKPSARYSLTSGEVAGMLQTPIW